MKTTAQGITVTHTTLLGAVPVPTLTNTFEGHFSSANPALTIAGWDAVNSGMFGWLPAIAAKFQRYKFKKLRLRYVPAGGTQASGRVMIAMQYDTYDTPPATTPQMMANMGASDGPVWQERSINLMAHGSNQPANGRLCRATTIPAGSTREAYDYGMLIVATDGMTIAQVTGQIYIDFEVELIMPTH